jgi:hypothetical protein
VSGTFSVSVPDTSASFEPFWRALREAVAYGEAHVGRADPARCFRAEALRPPTLCPSYVAAVSSVLTQRRSETFTSAAPQHMESGRLVLYFPDAAQSDGASSAESEGFFDIHGCPPWGTWVGFFVDESDLPDAFAAYLVAWVPPELLDLAAQGIAASTDQCITWLDGSEVALRAVLAAGAERLSGCG